MFIVGEYFLTMIYIFVISVKFRMQNCSFLRSRETNNINSAKYENFAQIIAGVLTRS